MIEIKFWFGDWIEADVNHARKIISNMLSDMTCGRENAIARINKNHLRGISAQELLEV